MANVAVGVAAAAAGDSGGSCMAVAGLRTGSPGSCWCTRAAAAVVGRRAQDCQRTAQTRGRPPRDGVHRSGQRFQRGPGGALQ